MDNQVQQNLFDEIKTFVSELHDVFGKKLKEVALYNRLLSKTNQEDTEFVQRHIKAFQTFFNQNPDYLDNKNLSNNASIQYSNNVYLPIRKILNRSDHSSHDAIYKHLALIYGMINIQQEKALDYYKNASTKQEGDIMDDFQNNILENLNLPDNKETRFLKETMGSIAQHVDVNDPMGSVSNLMQGDFFNGFLGNLQNRLSEGDLDVNNLLSSISGLITNQMDEKTMSQMDPNMINQLMNTWNADVDNLEFKQVHEHLSQLQENIQQNSTEEANNTEERNENKNNNENNTTPHEQEPQD